MNPAVLCHYFIPLIDKPIGSTMRIALRVLGTSYPSAAAVSWRLAARLYGQILGAQTVGGGTHYLVTYCGDRKAMCVAPALTAYLSIVLNTCAHWRWGHVARRLERRPQPDPRGALTCPHNVNIIGLPIKLQPLHLNAKSITFMSWYSACRSNHFLFFLAMLAGSVKTGTFSFFSDCLTRCRRTVPFLNCGRFSISVLLRGSGAYSLWELM